MTTQNAVYSHTNGCDFIKLTTDVSLVPSTLFDDCRVELHQCYGAMRNYITIENKLSNYFD